MRRRPQPLIQRDLTHDEQIVERCRRAGSQPKVAASSDVEGSERAELS